VPAGTVIDGLQLVSRPGGLTLAWTKSYTDGAGLYHSRVYAADVRASLTVGRVRALSGAGEVASGLSLAGDGNGDEVAAWDVCAVGSTACVVKSAVRGGRPGWFGRARTLGAVDAGDSPQASMAPGGASLVGWIAGGRVVLAGVRAGASAFGAAAPLSGDLAGNLALGFGPTGAAVATWTEGTFLTGVFAAVAR
jgi:hypothetical protein